MKNKIKKKELAKELYQVVADYEKVSFATVYQRSFFTKEKVLRYVGRVYNYSTSRIAI